MTEHPTLTEGTYAIPVRWVVPKSFFAWYSIARREERPDGTIHTRYWRAPNDYAAYLFDEGLD